MVDTPINTNLFQPLNLKNSAIPSQGPRGIPMTFDWTVSQSYSCDMSYVTTQKQLEYVQTIFVDNSTNAFAITVKEAMLPQTLTVPPYSQAYLPILSGIQPKLTIASAGATGSTKIVFLNIPVTPSVWSASNTPLVTDASGYLETIDMGLKPLEGNWNSYGNALAVADLGVQAILNGQSHYSLISNGTAQAWNVKASAGRIKTLEAYNNGATVAYLKAYDSAGVPTPGAGTIHWRQMIPANSGLISNLGPDGLLFPTGIAFTLVANLPDADATAVAANQFAINIGYL